MREMDRIRDQLHRALRGEAWHGPSLCEVLDGVGEDAARARPIAGAHSIVELVNHVIAWADEARARIEGRGRELPDEEDWPAGQAWKDTMARLERSHRELDQAIGRLTDAVLADSVPGRPETIYHLLHGVVQHDLYHAGQIALLKKARRQRRSNYLEPVRF